MVADWQASLPADNRLTETTALGRSHQITVSPPHAKTGDRASARAVHDYATDLFFGEIQPETLVAFRDDSPFLAAYNYAIRGWSRDAALQPALSRGWTAEWSHGAISGAKRPLHRGLGRDLPRDRAES